MTLEDGKVEVAMPIDFERLASAFVAEKWHLWDGIPDARRLQQMLQELFGSLSSSKLPDNLVGSGGLWVESIGGRVVVSIDPRLALHYGK